MESLPNNPILQFNSDTLVSIRKQYNLEKKEEMDKAIDLLDDWIKKQNHFTKKDFRREYLERQIIFSKGSIERAKSSIDKICTFRTIIPNFFEKCDGAKTYYEDTKDFCIQAVLPKLTKENHRILMIRVVNSKFDSKKYFSIYLLNVLFSQYIKTYDYFDGFIAVMDFRDVSIIDMVKEINLFELRQVMTIMLLGFAYRVKAIHIITTSSTVDMLIKLLKQMMSEKIGERIFVHKDVESVYEVVPKELLPKEYGGNDKPLQSLADDWIDVLNSKEVIESFKEMHEARTDESLRQKDSFNEQYMGVAGSFRSLTVD